MVLVVTFCVRGGWGQLAHALLVQCEGSAQNWLVLHLTARRRNTHGVGLSTGLTQNINIEQPKGWRYVAWRNTPTCEQQFKEEKSCFHFYQSHGGLYLILQPGQIQIFIIYALISKTLTEKGLISSKTAPKKFFFKGWQSCNDRKLENVWRVPTQLLTKCYHQLCINLTYLKIYTVYLYGWTVQYRKSKDHVKLPVAHYGHTGNHTPVFHSLTANLREADTEKTEN